VAFANPSFSEPPNLSLVLKEVKNYYDSGFYQQELAKQVKQAQSYVTEQAILNQKKATPKKLALILDIDETSLSNYNKMVVRDFVGSKNQIQKEVLEADAPAIKPVLTLYKTALKLGIKVFFVTGRKEFERKATQTNLIKAGYTEWSGLYLRPNQYPHPSIIPFKSGTRALITQQGYTIIASVGDQFSDIQGGYTQKGFKLPNPFYYLP
jgi:acid phosphatase